jgi:hypothetical protein
MSPLVGDYPWSCESVSARIIHLLLVKHLETKLEDRGTEKSGDGAFATQVHMLIRGLLGELLRPFLVVGPGSLDARLYTVSRCMSRVFEEAAIVTSIEGSHYAGPEVTAPH